VVRESSSRLVEPDERPVEDMAAEAAAARCKAKGLCQLERLQQLEQ
jgi:hypothetical protein